MKEKTQTRKQALLEQIQQMTLLSKAEMAQLLLELEVREGVTIRDVFDPERLNAIIREREVLIDEWVDSLRALSPELKPYRDIDLLVETIHSRLGRGFSVTGNNTPISSTDITQILKKEWGSLRMDSDFLERFDQFKTVDRKLSENYDYLGVNIRCIWYSFDSGLTCLPDGPFDEKGDGFTLIDRNARLDWYKWLNEYAWDAESGRMDPLTGLGRKQSFISFLAGEVLKNLKKRYLAYSKGEGTVDGCLGNRSIPVAFLSKKEIADWLNSKGRYAGRTPYSWPRIKALKEESPVFYEVVRELILEEM